jgi:putative endonuclease
MKAQNCFGHMLTNADRQTVSSSGVTQNRKRRANEHSFAVGSAFASNYNADKLGCFEAFADAESAIAREKQLKNCSRSKIDALIATVNAVWRDLLREMFAMKSSGGSH